MLRNSLRALQARSCVRSIILGQTPTGKTRRLKTFNPWCIAPERQAVVLADPTPLKNKSVFSTVNFCIIDRAPLLVPRPMAQAAFEPGIRTLKIQFDLT